MSSQLVDVDHQAGVVTDELAEELRRRFAPDRIITVFLQSTPVLSWTLL